MSAALTAVFLRCCYVDMQVPCVDDESNQVYEVQGHEVEDDPDQL
jgi:hypothetical protein